jgi:hypothetical protein
MDRSLFEARTILKYNFGFGVVTQNMLHPIQVGWGVARPPGMASNLTRRREGTKTRRRQQKWIGGSYRFFGISLLISSNFLFCWQDYVLRIPREEILQG